MSELERVELNKISSKLFTDNPSNEFAVQLIIQASDYLNLCSISDYAKANNMTYRGVKNHRTTVKLFNKIWVIDNE